MPRDPGISYSTERPELELFERLQARVSTVASHRWDRERIADPELRESLDALERVPSSAARYLPEIAFVAVEGAPSATYFSILRDSAHSNVSHLFDEKARRLLDEDRLAAVPGLLGAYPNALFRVSRQDLGAFVQSVTLLTSGTDYHALRARFGVLRTEPTFWRFADALQTKARASGIPDGGLLDFSRLEAY